METEANAMRVLIELHDTAQPIENVITACVFRPEVLVLLGDRKIEKAKYRKPLLSFFRMEEMNVHVDYRPCGLHDVQQIAQCLQDVIAEYGPENCMVDVGGGSETLLMAAGHVCMTQQITAVQHVPGSNKIRFLLGPEKGREEPFDLKLSLEQVVALSGGELLRNGHVGPEMMTEEMTGLIDRIFPLYLENKKIWPKFVQYLQVATRQEYWTGTHYDAPRMIFVNGQARNVNDGMMQKLVQAGVLSFYDLNDKRCRFTFVNATIGKCMCDVGVWLEMYLFSAMVQCGFFDAAQISMVVSWDDDEKGDRVQNEIDVAACAGLGQLFCSCKTSTPDPYMLHEIAVMTRRFGTQYATPVLATVCDMKKEAPSAYYRAEQMGVELIDINDLEKNQLMNRLKTLRRKWDRDAQKQ